MTLKALLVAISSVCLATSVSEASSPTSVKVDTTMAASIAAAVPSSVAQTLSASYSSILYGADYGMQCDGIDDATAGLNAVLAAAQTSSSLANAQASGVQVVLPGGVCLISGAITVAVTKSMEVTGIGVGATHLEWTAPTNGLMFTVSNNASLTINGMTISKRPGVNPSGSTFLGQALSIAAGGPEVTTYNTYLPRHQNVGAITVSNISIYPGNPNGQTDSWAVGVDLTDLAGPTISNVSVNMPGWGTLPNPNGLATPISGLPSPASPGPPNSGMPTRTSGTAGSGSTASNLGIGVADGVLLQGTDPTSSDPNAGDYSVDAVISDLSTSGGLVGLDFYRFQGAYISSFKSVADVIGIRADTPNNVSELISVSGSQFNDTVDGIYLNGVAGSSLTGDYFLHADGGVQGLPAWAAIWVRDGTNNSLSGNNINGDGSGSIAPEYGVYLTDDAQDGTGGFPDTVSGNEIAQVNGICIGNDKYVTAISVTGNSLRGCATYTSDGAANIPYYTDDNSYVNNISNTPDISETSDGLSIPQAVTVGSFATVGSLKILSDNVQTFLLDSSGNLSVAGNFTMGGNLTMGGSLVAYGIVQTNSMYAGNLFVLGNNHHSIYEEAAGGFITGTGVLPLTDAAGGFPGLSYGMAAVNGELFCAAGGFRISWRIHGHWVPSNGTAAATVFQATPETDGDTSFALSHLTVTPQPIANPPGVQVAVGGSFAQTLDCTADLREMVDN